MKVMTLRLVAEEGASCHCPISRPCGSCSSEESMVLPPTLLLGPRSPSKVGSGEGPGLWPWAPDSEVPAAVRAGSGTTSAHGDAEATVESVAPVTEKGSKG